MIDAGFRWISSKIKSDFVVKVDSDSVVHIDRLHRKLLIANVMNMWNHWFVCYNAHESPLIRDRYSKWYVPESDYAPAYYPRYCIGAGYAMKRDTFEAIVERMGKHKVFEIEDAFLTGVVAEDLGKVAYVQRAVAREYTIFSDCNANGELSLSITEGQFRHYGGYGTNLAAAWRMLKQQYCNQGW
ncbi:hypothetical protein PRIPAC_90050 [Pristionchus pacificus]|uniref:Hexosyltransferase n=1 Tax=Pristionchus pacificus TaxID=54126 RepID=A0A2A6CVY3_PRIPA|nr:hypothetical protein PRIPAC_90050 [Pristionchus pacificus]|eukprot:PDM82203.1 hypothetical protein PRIPAC_36596 [Pristionchus pacificus]